MKIKSLILSVVIVVMAVSSCSSTTASISNSKDYLNGSVAGTALTQLNKQFQAADSLDFGNVQNILSLSTVASTLTSLTSGSTPSVKDYTSGLISTAAGLVSADNSSKVIESLTSLAGMDLSGITGALQRGAKVDETKLSGIQSGLNDLFTLFKK